MVKDIMDSVLERLEKFLQTKTVIGEAIQIGNVTLIPVLSVSFGLGGGGGEGEHKGSDNGSGAGAGAGARISPKALVVVKDDEVSILPISERGSLEKIVSMVPDIVDKIKVNCCEGSEKKE
ncbi:GerW family sporulation protein [Desulfuribacillus stibiiarsenatis]|nr:spore germination protein GerW family protein [Desulfuribacillus stibiiarsenatis]